VRHEKLAVKLLLSVVAVLVGATGCNGDKAAVTPPAKEVATTVFAQTARLDSDTVSGCVSGAPLVKILIDLQPREAGCVPEVTPASVCVAPAGVVRFKVRNGCAALGEPGRPALEISQPTFKRALHTAETTTATGLFQSCSLKVQQLPAAATHVVLCEIANDAGEGFYKYSLSGQIVTLDPDVEVKRGH